MQRKFAPQAWRVECDVAHVVEVCILNAVLGRERRAPKQANRVNGRWSLKLDHNPLRMKRVALACEVPIKVGITFPESCLVAIVEPGITFVVRLVDRVAAARQEETIGKRDRSRGLRI